MRRGACHAATNIFLALSPDPRSGYDFDHSGCGFAVELFDSVGAALWIGMPTAGWMRKWRSGRDREDPAHAPVLAAARGEPLSQLLHLGARAMLAAAGADRAGLWLSGDRRGESSAG